ncbi:hypothetical protein B7Z17_05305, partial [Candidatus Saccharibacteria bacterium 32-49-10]
ELLIAIIIIGILASITVVSYSGIQNRSRDTVRMGDMAKIQDGLKLYIAEQYQYPTPVSVNGDWETSNEDTPTDFLYPLAQGQYVDKVPVDPSNTSLKHYAYYRYGAGSYGCDVNKGAYYVLAVKDMESSGRPHPKSPGWSCPSRDWHAEFDWVVGEFETP